MFFKKKKKKKEKMKTFFEGEILINTLINTDWDE